MPRRKKLRIVANPPENEDGFWQTRALGKMLIDVEIEHGESSILDDSAVTFHFDDGTEISVYMVRGELIIEED